MIFRVQSQSQGQPGFDLDHYRSEVDWYERHMRAIFAGPCTCPRWWCWRCVASRIRIVPRRSAVLARHGLGPWLMGSVVDECRRHEDTCPACISEHALWIDRSCPHPSLSERGAA